MEGPSILSPQVPRQPTEVQQLAQGCTERRRESWGPIFTELQARAESGFPAFLCWDEAWWGALLWTHFLLLSIQDRKEPTEYSTPRLHHSAEGWEGFCSPSQLNSGTGRTLVIFRPTSALSPSLEWWSRKAAGTDCHRGPTAQALVDTHRKEYQGLPKRSWWGVGSGRCGLRPLIFPV